MSNFLDAQMINITFLSLWKLFTFYKTHPVTEGYDTEPESDEECDEDDEDDEEEKTKSRPSFLDTPSHGTFIWTTSERGNP